MNQGSQAEAKMPSTGEMVGNVTRVSVLVLPVNGKQFKWLLHWFVKVISAGRRELGLKFAGPNALEQHFSNILQLWNPLFEWMLKGTHDVTTDGRGAALVEAGVRPPSWLSPHPESVRKRTV